MTIYIRPGGCCCGSTGCSDYLIGYIKHSDIGVNSITFDFSSITVEEHDLIYVFLANDRGSAAPLNTAPSGYSSILKARNDTFIELQLFFKEAVGGENSVTVVTSNSASADFSGFVIILRHPTGEFPKDGGFINLDGEVYSSGALTDPFFIHNGGPFLLASFLESDQLAIVAWATNNNASEIDVFDTGDYSPGSDIISGGGNYKVLDYTYSSNFDSQIIIAYRCVPKPGEDTNSALIGPETILEDLRGASIYSSVWTALP